MVGVFSEALWVPEIEDNGFDNEIGKCRYKDSSEGSVAKHGEKEVRGR